MSSTISYRPPRAWAASVAASWPGTRAALFGFLVIAPVAADQGGYWPIAWGWTSLGLLIVGMLALVLGDQRHPGPYALALVLLLIALFSWILLSSLWAASSTQPFREGERALVYVAAAVAALAIVRRSTVQFLLGGVWAAVVLVAGYGLLTRLLPDQLDVTDALAGNRLSDPLGYWNALGIFSAMGALLAVGLAARAESRIVRAAAAGSLLVLVPTLYFTYSRGAWIAFAIGVLAAVVVDGHRLQLVTSMILIAPWAAAGVFIASQSDALTHTTATVSAAAPEGHRLLWILALLALGAAVGMVAAAVVEQRFRVPARGRLAYAIGLWLVAIAGASAVFVAYGTPWAIAERGYRAFVSGPTSSGSNLNARLFTFSGSGRIEQWRVAWRDAEAHPWLGSGSGTYERFWNEFRSHEGKVRDAHNLYLEALAEIGPLGLACLVAALAVPLVAVQRARGHPLLPAMVGAYVALLVHAAVDWDWEVTGVTLTALLCGVGLVLAARGRSVPFLGTRAKAAALLPLVSLAVFAFVGLRGNRAIAASETAAGNAQWAKSAADARTASSWAPWSSRPWQLLGEAQYNQGDLAAARGSFHSALAKDPSDWTIWLDLALASSGAERGRAFAQARKLNPRNSLLPLFERAKPSAAGG